jgi:hypothetical protein
MSRSRRSPPARWTRVRSLSWRSTRWSSRSTKEFDKVVHALAQKLPAVADHLDQARANLLGVDAVAMPFNGKAPGQIGINIAE